jgi:hypothetical protein
VKRMRAILILVVMSIGSSIAGCGGSSPETDAQLTKTKLVAQGDAICGHAAERRNEQLKVFIAEHRSDLEGISERKAQGLLVLKVGLPLVSDEIDQLRELGYPAGEKKQLEAFYTALEDAVKKGEADPATALAPTGNPFGRADRLAKAYGFKLCGNI